MKKILILLALLACSFAWSQDMAPQLRKEYFTIYYVAPGAVGNNVIAKANKGSNGYGLNVTLYSYEQFHFKIGYEFAQYDVTDASLASAAEVSNISNLYVECLYKIPLVKDVDFNPHFSIGSLSINQRAEGGNSYGRQHGPALTPGFNVDYRIAGGFRVFVGANYCLSFLKTNTSDEYKSFYSTIQQVNIVAGFKF